MQGPGKFGSGYCITFLQRLDEGLKKQLSGQNPLDFPRVVSYILIGWGPGLLVVNIIGNYCCMRVPLYAEMLKETENQETRLFLSHFYHWWHFDWGGSGAPGYAYNCNFNSIYDIKILCGFLLVCPCVHVRATLMVPFCMIMLNMVCWYW